MIADLRAKIRANWNPPSQTGASGLSRKIVQIRMTLMPDGTVRNPRIMTSSGSSSVDRSVIRAITTLRQKIMAPPEPLDFILDFNLY